MMLFCACTEALRVACVQYFDVLELIASIQVSMVLPSSRSPIHWPRWLFLLST